MLESMQGMGLGLKGMERFWAAILLNVFSVLRLFNVGYVCVEMQLDQSRHDFGEGDQGGVVVLLRAQALTCLLMCKNHT